MEPYSSDDIKRRKRRNNDLGNIETEEVAAYITPLIASAMNLAKVLEEGLVKFIRLETTKGDIMIGVESNHYLIRVNKR
ncbi:MAG: roadblock/LC7 domain-containing protein [Promethearchaeia archaeon]